MQCEVWSVECEDFASSLAEKKTACRGKDTVGTGFSSNYRSFIFGKLPPPACPGLCIDIATMHHTQVKMPDSTFYCVVRQHGMPVSRKSPVLEGAQ